MTVRSRETREQVEDAKAAPAQAFDSPSAVVHAEGLTLAEKLAILKRWEQAEIDLERAAGEGMEGPTRTRHDEISKALIELDPTNDAAGQVE